MGAGREIRVVLGDDSYLAREALAHLLAADDGIEIVATCDDEGVVPFRELAPAAGPPPDPPLARLGPSVAGGLSGFLLEENGRLGIRMSPRMA